MTGVHVVKEAFGFFHGVGSGVDALVMPALVKGPFHSLCELP